MITNLLISNIGRLVTVEQAKDRHGILGVIEDACVYVENGRISWFGSSAQLPNEVKDCESYNVMGATVTPGLIDCHTHLVHGGSRQNEFLMRSYGKKYWEIAKAGGGIMSTVRATREISYDKLYELSEKRLKEANRLGTTTFEIKSGYGLDLQTELKMLKVIRTLKDNHPSQIFSTFLGAHVVPTEYKDRRDDYIHLVIDEMLPKIAQKKLCNFCDIFVEEGAFTLDEARKLASAANKFDFDMRLHIDQFSDNQGGLLAKELGAISADHLDFISDEGISALKKANTVGVVLPGATFFTGGKHYPPARKMIDSGVRVAISTDYNPGTNPCIDLMLTATIGATQMEMTLDEAWQAITINAAASLGIEKDCGSITIGKRADLAIFDAPDEYYPMYRYGKNCVKAVVIDGQLEQFDS